MNKYKKWEKPKVVWPVYEGKKVIKEGTIDGVPMKKVWEQCQEEAEEYLSK